jgi:hypothetical protein
MAFIGNGAQLTDLDAGDIASGTLAVARGGTGTASPSPVGGTNITISGSWPNQTVTAAGGGVTSLNGETGAITNTTVGAIGSYVSSPYAITSKSGGTGATSVASGSTTSGSNIRVNATSETAGTSGYTGGSSTTIIGDSQPWPGGGTTLSGTWRSITGCSIVVYASGCSYYSNWRVGLWVRVS